MIKTGIVGYGVKIPYYRIKTQDISQAWLKNINPEMSFLVKEKSVPGFDEDTITLSTEAALNAIKRAEIKSAEIGAIIIGSESHPYAVKPSAVTVAEAIGMGSTYFCVDTEFACKAGTAAIQLICGMVGSGMIKYGLAIGADTAQGLPGDALEYTAAAGAGAYILGTENLIAELVDTLSFTSDTPDFWRRSTQIYPKHAGRFTGEPAYFKHITGVAKLFFKKTKTKAQDYDQAVFHMPNGKFPRIVAQELGFKTDQIATGLTVDNIGNPYSGSSPIGLANILDSAKPNQLILVISYGSGSGSDAFAFKTTERLTKVQNIAPKTCEYINHKSDVSYTSYLRMTGKLP